MDMGLVSLVHNRCIL